MLITHKDVVGQMARWAVRQHPYGRPEGLFGVTDAISAAAQEWPIGPSSLKMREFDSSCGIEAWLRTALLNHHVLAQWNTPQSQHTQPIVFSSRYFGPAAEDDFIDIDALLRNVAMGVWRENEAELAAESAGVGYTDGPASLLEAVSAAPTT